MAPGHHCKSGRLLGGAGSAGVPSSGALAPAPEFLAGPAEQGCGMSCSLSCCWDLNPTTGARCDEAQPEWLFTSLGSSRLKSDEEHHLHVLYISALPLPLPLPLPAALDGPNHTLD